MVGFNPYFISSLYGSGAVSVHAFGAVGNADGAGGGHDDTAAIQAAIDYAYAHGIQAVTMRALKYRTTGPIYLDPPGNLRSSLTGTLDFSFTLALIGEPGQGTAGVGSGWGTQIVADSGSYVALWVGPGWHQTVSCIAIVAPAPATLAALSTTGVGIAIAGAGGGAHGTLIDRCHVSHYYVGIQTGVNQNNLGDSNTFFKCEVSSCYFGYAFGQNQNFVNSLYDCTAGQCKVSVRNTQGIPVNIFGGNFSRSIGAYNKYSISGATSLTTTTLNGQFTYTFTVTVASPDAYMINGDMDAFAIKTSNYGTVPLRRVSYNSGTAALTVILAPNWLHGNFGPVGPYSALSTGLIAELQAATTLYACEEAITFWGTGIHAHGSHVENSPALTCLLKSQCDVNGDQNSVLDGIRCNWKISGEDQKANTDGSEATFYCQQQFGFVQHTDGMVTIKNLSTSENFLSTSEPILIELNGPAVGVADSTNIQIEKTDWYAPNIRVAYNFGGNAAGQLTGTLGGYYSLIRGGPVIHDRDPFLPHTSLGFGGYTGSSNTDGWKRGRGQYPTLGYFPATWIVPRLTAGHITTLTGALPAAGTYPIPCGDVVYSLEGGANKFAKSTHSYYSYGQDLTINWSYKGHGTFVTLSNTTLMRAGLRIGLNNGGGNIYYVVTRVYPSLGGVDVCRDVDDGTDDSYLAGTDGTTYTGSTVKQEAYAITQVT